MPTVLLITGQDRLRALFASMEQAGMFRLRTAPSLAQCEEEIAFRVPGFLFVENHLSGLSGSALANYLRGLLPEDVGIILMGRDAADCTDFREDGGLFFLDLSEGDEALQCSVTKIIPQGVPQHNPPPAEPSTIAPQSARELLFDQPGCQAPADKDKRTLWLILLAIVAIALGAIAYHARGKGSPAPAQRAAPLVPREGARAGRSPASGAPLAPAMGNHTAGKTPAPTVRAIVPPGKARTYSVQPGDTLLKILVQDFGFAYQDALGMIPEFKRLNNLSDLKKLKPGQRLVIPRTGKPADKPN